MSDLGAFALLVASLISPLPAAADSLPRSVLYIEQTDPGTPFSAAVAVSFRSTLEANNGKHFDIYWENLDIPRFAGEQYQALQRSYIMERHRKTPIGIIVAVGSLSLDFALRLRTEQWPAVPIVFGAVDEDAAARYVGQTDVTGLLLRLRLSDSVIAARALVPGLRRVAVVGDSFDVQAYRRHFKDELPVIAREVGVIDLTGLPIAEVTASFAHEISQPIGAITANSNAAMRWLAKATPDLDEARAALTRVVGEGHRAAELIVGIRSMFKKDGQRRAPLDVNELIRAALVISQGEAKKHQITIKTDLFSEIPQVSGDRIQLQQVILNLVMNAIEAMDTVIDRERLLAVKSESQNPDLVVITVKDSGPGIDSKDVDRIFKAFFFTTKSRGMGMGLSICRSIIDAHSGSLSVSPGNPHGAIFQVALRTSAPPPATS